MSEHILHDVPPRSDSAAAGGMIAALHDPNAFDHPVSDLRVIETHISWVILTGRYAYKIKKPVDFGFVDFSSLEKRRHFCSEELRLNRRFAPEIYLERVEIRGGPESPRIGGDGEILDYAIKMREFSQSCLLSAHAAAGDLQAQTVDAVADSLAAMHATSETAPADSEFGSAALVERWSEENLTRIEATIAAKDLPASYFELKNWYRDNSALLEIVESRRRQGYVRDCHGDLHLGNMALIDGEVRFFDCIEFNPELRWIDTISETAFVAMDLHARGYPQFGWRFVNRYLERGGDYAGIVLLRYYLVYRALVRAKVEALRIGQQQSGKPRPWVLKPAFEYLDLAARFATENRGALILMHGLSGSGKSTLAAQLVEELGAIRLRSDVERKRLFELAPTDDSGSAPGGGIYTPAATKATYRRLAELAAAILDANLTVIVDAATLHAAERSPFLELLTAHNCNGAIVACDAPEAELRRRILAREDDPSEANLEVLQNQLKSRQPIGAAESAAAPVVHYHGAATTAEVADGLRRLLFS